MLKQALKVTLVDFLKEHNVYDEYIRLIGSEKRLDEMIRRIPEEDFPEMISQAFLWPVNTEVAWPEIDKLWEEKFNIYK